MTAKETLIETIRHMPDDLTAELVRALELASQPGEAVGWTAEEMSDEDWHRFASASLRDELADARQDIYTLEDGKPYDVAR